MSIDERNILSTIVAIVEADTNCRVSDACKEALDGFLQEYTTSIATALCRSYCISTVN